MTFRNIVKVFFRIISHVEQKSDEILALGACNREKQELSSDPLLDGYDPFVHPRLRAHLNV